MSTSDNPAKSKRPIPANVPHMPDESTKFDGDRTEELAAAAKLSAQAAGESAPDAPTAEPAQADSTSSNPE